MPVSDQLVTSVRTRVAEQSRGQGRKNIHHGTQLCPAEVTSSPPESVREKAC